MDFVRPLSEDRAFDSGYPGYQAQILFFNEGATMVASYIVEGGCGPGLHYHYCDQVYFLVSGHMNVRLGDQTHSIGPNTLVFIPAGTAHCNWNEGPGTELHFEVLAPTPVVGVPVAIPVDSPADVPPDRRAALDGFVLAVEPGSLMEAKPGFRIQLLIDRDNGSANAAIMYAEVDPGGGGPGTHVHEFDQYYLVLEGTLTVEVALHTHQVEAPALAVLPAGVPHRQYNDGTRTEKHLSVLVPPPVPDEPWDRGVEFTTTGEDLFGITTGSLSR
jgi:mannose-6-phosphate isomerase-like protein (cupin superfamily)